MSARKKSVGNKIEVSDPLENADTSVVGFPKLGPYGALGTGSVVAQQFDQLRQEKEKLQEQLEEMSTSLQNEQSRSDELEKELEKIRSEYERSLEQIAELEEQVKALTQEKESLDLERKQLADINTELQADKERLSQEVADLQKQLDKAMKTSSPALTRILDEAVSEAMTDYQAWLENMADDSGHRVTVVLPIQYRIDCLRFKTFAAERGVTLFDKGQHATAASVYSVFVSLFLKHRPDIVQTWLVSNDDASNTFWRGKLIEELYRMYYVYQAALKEDTE